LAAEELKRAAAEARRIVDWRLGRFSSFSILAARTFDERWLAFMAE
jgi:hypothetical protein